MSVPHLPDTEVAAPLRQLVQFCGWHSEPAEIRTEIAIGICGAEATYFAVARADVAQAATMGRLQWPRTQCPCSQSMASTLHAKELGGCVQPCGATGAITSYDR